MEKGENILCKNMNDIPTVANPVIRWYVIHLPKASLKMIKELEGEMEYRKALGDDKQPVLDYFAPVLKEAKIVEGKVKESASPFCLNYVFIRASLEHLRTFRVKYPSYNLVKNQSCAGGYMFVPDREMELFRFVARAYHDIIPCIAPTARQLVKGDRVRVTGGQFEGIEGTLLTQQGKLGGRVVITVSNCFAVPTLEIGAEYLEILSFSDRNKHIYGKLDLYYPRIRRALRHFFVGELQQADLHHVEQFLSQLSRVNVESEKVRARYLAYLMMSYMVMKDREATAYYVRECHSLISGVTNLTTRAFILTAMYACTGDTCYRDMAKSIVATWSDAKLSAKQLHILEDMEFYSRNNHPKQNGQ